MKRNKYQFVYYFIVISIVLISAVVSSFSRYIIQYSEYFAVSTTDDLKSKRIIVLDAGHGGEDSGAVGIDGTLEKNLNLSLCLQIRDILECYGCKVVLTREDDRLMYSEDENIKGKKKHYDLKNRYLTASGYDDAIFVSIHMNKYPIEKYKGVQVYYSKHNKESRNIAQSIQSNTMKYLQNENSRQIKQADGNIYLLDRLECPAVLVECGFLSNWDECKNLNDSEYRKKLALIISASLIENIY